MFGASLFQTFTTVLDWLGLVAFTVTGALVASRKGMDIVGFAFLGTVTGIGGGTLRDLLLDAPVFWIREPAYLVTCVVVAALVFFAGALPERRYRILLWLDAAGLALFAVAGAEKALALTGSSVVAAVMGVITATFGGVIRDLLGGEIPAILTREIYALAAFAGAVTLCTLVGLGATRDVAVACGFAAGFLVRAAALRGGWSLPRYGRSSLPPP